MLLSVWFIHEAAIKERAVDFIKAADFFVVLAITGKSGSP